jgi:hypothetical protein
MPLDIQLVHPIDADKPHERQMWDALSSALGNAFQGDPRKSILLGNFNCGRQIDACLIWPEGLAIIELKNYQGQLHAPLNEQWFIGTRVVNAGGALNPLEQVRGARHALGDRLRRPWGQKFSGTPPPNWKYAAGRVVFQPGTAWQDLLDDQTRRWFAISTLADIAAELALLKIDTYALNADQIKFIKDTILSTPARRIVNPQQQQIIDQGLLGITLGHLTLGAKISEVNETRPAMDRSVKGPVSAVVRTYPLADEDGFLLHLVDARLENGERQITVSQNFSGVEKWDRLKRGLRLGVYQKQNDKWAARLFPAQPKNDGTWSNRSGGATLSELDDLAGLDVATTLQDLGALAVGTKSEVYGETNRNRDELCVLYPDDKPEVGLAAYVLTTVLPLMEDARQA